LLIFNSALRLLTKIIIGDLLLKIGCTLKPLENQGFLLMQMLCKCNPNAKELQSKCTAYAMQMLCKIMQIKLNKTKLNIKYKYKICLLV